MLQHGNMDTGKHDSDGQGTSNDTDDCNSDTCHYDAYDNECH